jgi:putative membrane protein
LAIVTILVSQHDGRRIFLAVTGVGWGLGALLLIHPVQTALSGLGWRALLRGPVMPGWLEFTLLRWIRESVNGLLPVAQLGGNLVGARLMVWQGVKLHDSGAATAVDLTMEALTQLLFTGFGVGLLVLGRYDPAVTGWIGGATLGALIVVAALVFAQWRGLFRLLESGLLRLAQKPQWSGLGDIAGLHDAIVAVYRDPRRLTCSGFYHLLSWLLGGVEVMLALHLLDVAVDLPHSLMIESIGQALRTVGFAIPASLGIQEGGTMLICSLLGIGPQSALELALLKRVREVLLGVPGLVVWQLMESRHAAQRLARPPQVPRGAQ